MAANKKAGKVKVRALLDYVSSKPGEVEVLWGHKFVHEVKGEGEDAVHALICECEQEEVQSLIDAKLVSIVK